MVDSHLYLVALVILVTLLLVSTIALVLTLHFFKTKVIEFADFYYQQSHFKVHDDIAGIRGTLGVNRSQGETIVEVLSKISQHLYSIERLTKDGSVNYRKV